MPKFLLEVYERSLQEDGGADHPEQEQNGGRHTRSTSDGNDQLITALDKEVIEQSDIIMTFLNKSESPSLNHHRNSFLASPTPYSSSSS